jgi:hypothetical protein
VTIKALRYRKVSDPFPRYKGYLFAAHFLHDDRLAFLQVKNRRVTKGKRLTRIAGAVAQRFT